jgi:hypothetical protein
MPIEPVKSKIESQTMKEKFWTRAGNRFGFWFPEFRKISRPTE